MVIADLKPRLISGDVEAVDIVINEYGKIEEHPLPPEWWETVRLFSRSGSKTGIDWEQGDKSKSPGGTWARHRIFLRRDKLDSFWPTRSQEPADPIAKAERRKTGPKTDWKIEVAAELIRIIHSAGKIPDSDQALAKVLLQFCQTRWGGWEPGDSTTRELISQLLRPVRK